MIGTVFSVLDRRLQRQSLESLVSNWVLVEGDKGKKMKAKMEAEALFPYL